MGEEEARRDTLFGNFVPGGFYTRRFVFSSTEGFGNVRAANPGSADAAVNTVAGKIATTCVPTAVFVPQTSV